MWWIFWERHLARPVIDVRTNRVAGIIPGSWHTQGYLVDAYFELRHDGLHVWISATLLAGSLDLGHHRRLAARFTDAVEEALNREVRDSPSTSSIAEESTEWVPIARPTSEVGMIRPSEPVYGPVPVLKRGGEVLLYGIASVICCPFVGPLTLHKGFRAMGEFQFGDAGDSRSVYFGLILGTLSTLFLLFYLFVWIANSL